MSNPLDDSLTKLEQRATQVGELGAAMMSACGGNSYPLDLLMLAALNRTSAQLSGFLSLIRAKNFICAAPILRLQLDTALRIYAANLAADPHHFAFQVFEGEKVSKLKDRTGKKMNDAYLVGKLSDRYPWVRDVYKHTSGYVHLSEKHLFNAVTSRSAALPIITFKISGQDTAVSDEDYVEAVEAFSASLTILFELVGGWVFTKANPEKAAELRKAVKQTDEPLA